MLIPAPALLGLAFAWLILGILAAVFPILQSAWWIAGALLIIGALADALRAWLEAPPATERHVATALPLGVPSWATLHLHRDSGRACRLIVYDHTPSAFDADAFPAQLRLQPRKLEILRYRIRPLARGDHHFGPIALRIESPWRLWQRQVRVDANQAVKVFPNFAAYSRHALQAVDANLAQTGMLKSPRRGQGLEFDQLREYREGDSPRQIDWKASRRFDRLIARQYQDERDQRILLLADCGRRMGARDGELSHFDHALDALLLLAYVGLRHGDAVGIMTLGGIERRLAPHKTTAALVRILNAVYDLQPTHEATDFEHAAQILMKHERKRALVVILSNLRDEDDENLLAACRLLGRRHLVLVASLREVALDEACATTADDIESLALRAAALDYRSRRDAAFRRLRQAGVQCLDVLPQGLAVETVNRYLAIKAAGRL